MYAKFANISSSVVKILTWFLRVLPSRQRHHTSGWSRDRKGLPPIFSEPFTFPTPNWQTPFQIMSKRHLKYTIKIKHWMQCNQKILNFLLFFYSVVMALDGWNWTLETQQTQNTDNTSITLEDHLRSLFLTTSSHPSSNLGIKACTHSNSMWNSLLTGNTWEWW